MADLKMLGISCNFFEYENSQKYELNIFFPFGKSARTPTPEIFLALIENGKELLCVCLFTCRCAATHADTHTHT